MLVEGVVIDKEMVDAEKRMDLENLPMMVALVYLVQDLVNPALEVLEFQSRKKVCILILTIIK